MHLQPSGRSVEEAACEQTTGTMHIIDPKFNSHLVQDSIYFGRCHQPQYEIPR